MSNEKMIKLEELLKSKGWEEVKNAIKQRQESIAGKILYGDCMDVKDPNLTQSDLLRHELKCLNWVMDKLPSQLVENPNYRPEEEEIQEPNGEEQREFIERMFQQPE